MPFEDPKSHSTSTPGPIHINIKFNEEETELLRDEAYRLHTSPTGVVRAALAEYFLKQRD